jgi:hypothetical protein
MQGIQLYAFNFDLVFAFRGVLCERCITVKMVRAALCYSARGEQLHLQKRCLSHRICAHMHILLAGSGVLPAHMAILCIAEDTNRSLLAVSPCYGRSLVTLHFWLCRHVVGVAL